MIHTFADVADFAASLSLIFVLALAYGALHRRMPEGISPQFVLGTLFGIIACLEMQRPLQPFDGVLIDMRNVPIALAGAFLGRSGLAACLVIALTSRLYLGGAGAIAGVTGMMVAGGMGYLWHILTIRAERRRLGQMIVLAAMMSTHVATGLFLPGQPMLWFYQEVAASMALLNLLSVSLAALILERERIQLLAEAALRDAASVDADNGLLVWPKFQKDIAFRMSAAPIGEIAGLALIRLDNHAWVSKVWGEPEDNVLLGAIRVRLEQSDYGFQRIGLIPRHGIVVPLSSNLAAQPDEAAKTIQSLIEGQEFALPGGLKTKLRARVLIYQAMSHQAMSDLLQQLSEDSQRRRPQALEDIAPQSQVPRPQHSPAMDVPNGQVDLLFDKAALLMSTRSF
ncbi:LytS/YhcK type 5TM receptor domain-containing protein [Aestuariivita boseongensis]|uniref:LytS/YhcK type 5TM receptor domain-containing protein n=1 Tax=Aestuariivita boseongensis TaxID=1470562 RepID=UPI0006810863|nr:LytS/YhcK type 5TM receptor domain-containing protein [Aestuariivita boseongensis]